MTTNTMKAAVVTELGQPLALTDVPIPQPGPYQALVKVDYSGVCHTDLHAAQGDWPVKPSPPFVPGHEGSGVVVELGPEATRVKAGQRVGNAWLASACGACQYCQRGWETLCENQSNSGYGVDGSFAQYMLVDSRYCPIIPDGADPAAVAPILCAGVTVYKGLKVADTHPGEWMLISGIGGLGHIAVQYARAMGMRVAAIDVAEDKLALARQHGAEVCVNAATSADPVTEIKDQVGGGGVHGALVTAVGSEAFPQAVGALRRGGTVSLVGLPPEAFPLDIFTTVLFGLTVRGSIVGGRADMEECLGFFANGQIKPTFTTRPLSSINDIFDEMLAGHIDGRIVLDMSA
ncbi:MAG: alcohol dehydrogenase AdhP [Micrococcales bacterium]|nr:alcohol dehydrogenase AdhP [Micrococcales bacterium]